MSDLSTGALMFLLVGGGLAYLMYKRHNTDAFGNPSQEAYILKQGKVTDRTNAFANFMHPMAYQEAVYRPMRRVKGSPYYTS